MNAKLIIPNRELVEIPPPYPEPRVAYQNAEPRTVNNLTLIDGKTFLSTTLSGDIMPPVAPVVGFFSDCTLNLAELLVFQVTSPIGVSPPVTLQTYHSKICKTNVRSILRDLL